MIIFHKPSFLLSRDSTHLNVDVRVGAVSVRIETSDVVVLAPEAGLDEGLRSLLVRLHGVDGVFLDDEGAAAADLRFRTRGERRPREKEVAESVVDIGPREEVVVMTNASAEQPQTPSVQGSSDDAHRRCRRQRFDSFINLNRGVRL